MNKTGVHLFMIMNISYIAYDLIRGSSLMSFLRIGVS